MLDLEWVTDVLLLLVLLWYFASLVAYVWFTVLSACQCWVDGWSHDVLMFFAVVSFLPSCLQRFRFNVRRVVKKGAAANAATEEAIAAARAAADAVAHAAGIQLRAPWEVAADEEELARMLRLPVRKKGFRKKCDTSKEIEK